MERLLKRLLKLQVAWISRHPLLPEQEEDLIKKLQEEFSTPIEVRITTRNITWSASSDEDADQAGNLSVWRELEDFNFICGVFPPVSLEAKPTDMAVLTPISIQDPSRRIGNSSIPFIHARWAWIR